MGVDIVWTYHMLFGMWTEMVEFKRTSMPKASKQNTKWYHTLFIDETLKNWLVFFLKGKKYKHFTNLQQILDGEKNGIQNITRVGTHWTVNLTFYVCIANMEIHLLNLQTVNNLQKLNCIHEGFNIVFCCSSPSTKFCMMKYTHSVNYVL